MTVTKRDLDKARQDVLDSVDVLLNGSRRLESFWEAVEALEVTYRHWQHLADRLDAQAPANARDTSIQASNSLPDLASKRGKVLRAILARHQLSGLANGLTTDEIEVQLGWPHTTVSSAVNALEQRGLIRDSGRRRPTRAGRARGERGLPVTTAIVYEPTAHAYRLSGMEQAANLVSAMSG